MPSPTGRTRSSPNTGSSAPTAPTLWLSGRGLVMSRRPDGRAERLVSIMADVSERKLAEESLRLDARAAGPGAPGRADGRLRLRPRQRRALVGAADLRRVRRLARDLHADPRVGHRSGPSGRPQGIHPGPAGRRSPAGSRSSTSTAACGRTVASPGSATAARPSTTPAGGRCAASASRSTSPSASSPSRRCRRPTGGRTASSRRWRTSCAIRWRRSATPSSCCAAGGHDDPQVVWCRDVIDRQVTQMARLLEDLLDVSRLTRGQFALRRERLALPAVVEHALEIAQPRIEEHGHSLSRQPARGAAACRRRPDPPGAGVLQPADQRRQVHAGRRPAGPDDGGGRRRGRGAGQRQRHRHFRRADAAPVRDVHARAIRWPTARRAGWASACRSPAAWSRCTADGSARTAPASAGAANSSSACRWRGPPPPRRRGRGRGRAGRDGAGRGLPRAGGRRPARQRRQPGRC